jgi:hypothetical protein
LPVLQVHGYRLGPFILSRDQDKDSEQHYSA